MTTVLMVVAEVSPYEPDKMPVAENDDVVEELSAARPDPAFSGVKPILS